MPSHRLSLALFTILLATHTTAIELLDGGVRFILDADSFDPARPTTLLIYATPNGNTAEQTLGGSGQGIDWHFDIQHIGAQVRRWREIEPRRNIVLAIVQAPAKSWPAFRKEHGDEDAPRRVRAIVAQLTERFGGTKARVILSGHSGGGSFLFSYLDGADEIVAKHSPVDVQRIVFLDANYSYSDAARHGDKLLAWLRADTQRRLVVIAYDDREITLDGKRVVGPEGGTWRASGRMIARFRKDMDVTESRVEPFQQFSALDGRIRIYVHPNPQNKILHTALVGEMNGLLQGVTVGTALENAWGTFGGPRAYEHWIRPAPVTQPATRPTTQAAQLPPHPAGAISGKAFAERIAPLTREQREPLITAEVLRGNVPQSFRQFTPIRVTSKGKDGREHTGEYQVSPDYLSIGDDGDSLRIPLTPMTACPLAEQLGCLLPTRKMVDDIYAAADVKLEPQPLVKERQSIATFLQHNQLIEEQLAGRPYRLIAGIKKDVVLTNRLKDKPGHVAIYGWHKLDGQPIQPLTTVHVDGYVDYSHGIRLVARDMLVDGRPMRVDDVLRDPDLCGLISDEGVIDVQGLYPDMIK
jgi:hypothetical protein